MLYVCLFVCLIGVKRVSPQDRAASGHFHLKTSTDSSKEAWKTSGKPLENLLKRDVSFLIKSQKKIKKKKNSCSVTEFCARNRACRHIPQASNNPDDTRFEAQSPYMTTGIALHCYDSKFDSLHCHNITFWVTVLISWRQLIDTIHFNIYI